MRRLHWMIVRTLPGPFLGWLGTLMFLFLMQFLMKYLPDIVGKGLPLGVIIELIAYNLAYMVVLAVPMAVLLATLMTFGHLAESNAYLAIKSAGISLGQLVWPVVVAGLVVTGGMLYFNNEVLPEANFRARNLWQDVRQKKPGFDLQPGIFYDGLNRYSILVQERPPESDSLYDITIYDYTDGTRRQAVIKASRGHLKARPDAAVIDLVLEDGEMHRRKEAAARRGERYERVQFQRHRLSLDLSDFAFERSDPRDSYRSDRTTPTIDMMRFVDSLETAVRQERMAMRDLAPQFDTTAAAQDSARPAPVLAAEDTAGLDTTVFPDARRAALAGVPHGDRHRVYQTALDRVRHVRSRLSDVERSVRWQSQRADRYRVEIHKKISIGVACLLFVLIGAPLGLSIRRGGLGVIGGVALGIFMFYWVTLVQGEKLADRGMLEPWVGMWAANAAIILLGVGLVSYVAFDLAATPPLFRRLHRWKRSWWR